MGNRTFIPEWGRQSGVQLTFPHEETDWAYMLGEVTDCYVNLAREIALRETLLVVTPHPQRVQRLLHDRLPEACHSHIIYKECPTNDTWARDHAFLSVATPQGTELLDFRFNGWGGKFEATLDNAINRHLVNSDAPTLRGIYRNCLDFELEGGSVETDGKGTLLTTSECLLNPNRNAQYGKADIERLLAERLGATHILWLDHGALQGDDTDSHIDTLARLCPNDTIVYVQCNDESDTHFASLDAMEKQLRTFHTPEGREFRLIAVPLPRPITDENGERLPATYANYLVMNQAVLMPTYAQPDYDTLAAQALQEAFPDREIVPMDCRPLIRQHGSLHCATMQYPEGVMPQLR